jgi:hypothetical protein
VTFELAAGTPKSEPAEIEMGEEAAGSAKGSAKAP